MIEQGGIIPYLPKYAGDTVHSNGIRIGAKNVKKWVHVKINLGNTYFSLNVLKKLTFSQYK